MITNTQIGQFIKVFIQTYDNRDVEDNLNFVVFCRSCPAHFYKMEQITRIYGVEILLSSDLLPETFWKKSLIQFVIIPTFVFVMKETPPNKPLVYKVEPVDPTIPVGELWKNIKAWLYVCDPDSGAVCFGPTPFNSVENAEKQGRAMCAKWGTRGFLTA